LNSLPPPFFISAPIPEIVSTGIIFPLTYMCTQYLHYFHPPTPFSQLFLPKLVPLPAHHPRQDLFLKIEWSCDPPIPLLRIYLKECKSAYNKDTCTPMFIAALVTIAKL
jgi:hypothetical protein